MVKSGDKTLTLSGINSYTGGTTISVRAGQRRRYRQRHAGAEHRR
ncbi:autotransporter-associated beta strand repeat-containing protein [Salmonella enterica]